MSDRIVNAVQQLRAHRSLSYDKLAERLAEIGRPIPVMGLRRLEKGERRVDLDDLLALARALDVPPLILMLPVGVDELVELLPGQIVDTWSAVKWVTGEAAFPGSADGDESTLPLAFYREHERLIGAWRAEANRVVAYRRALDQFTDAASERREDLARRVAVGEQQILTLEDALRRHRQQMRRDGRIVVLPALPSELAYLDETGLDFGAAVYRRVHGAEDGDIRAADA